MTLNISKENYLSEILDRTTCYFSQEELQKICNTTVVIAGVGASGNMVTEFLARWGIAKFRLIDMDKFDLSNINRQLYATPDTIGCWKTEIAAKRIKEINPFADIEMIYNEKISKTNSDSLIKGSNLIINASDTKSSFLVLHKLAQKYRIPLIEGHGWNLTGIKIRTFNYASSSQRCMDEPFSINIFNTIIKKFLDATKKDFNLMSDIEIDDLDKGIDYSGGSLGTTTTLVGSLIVTEAIKLLSGKGRVICYPKEISLDMFNYKMRIGNKHSFFNVIKTIITRKNEIFRNFRSK